MLAERLLKHRASRILCAAASAAGLQLFTGTAVLGTLPDPDILTCEVVPSEYGPFETHYGDTNHYPGFYLTWDSSNYSNPYLITFNFYQGLNSTTIGTNCWAVWTPFPADLNSVGTPPAYGYTSDEMEPFTSAAENGGCNFFPFQSSGGYLSVFDSSIDYEIGVQATGGGDQSDVVWIQAAYST